MSGWSVAVLVIAVIGGARCSQETASPPQQTAPPKVSTTSEVSATSVTSETAAPSDTSQPPPPVMKTPRPQPPDRSAQPPLQSFAVYALSRGKGVPPEAREALRRVVEFAEEEQKRGVKVTVTSTRIGIEGETRVCLSYEDSKEGARAYERARAIVKNVDLLNLEVEPCGETANKEEEDS
jgi:hypothetical protein